MSYRLWDVLGELRSDAYEWVDLTHPLDNGSPYWAGIPEGSVELGKTCFDWGNEMLDCLIQTFKFPGQFGTHIDFPGHFIKNAPLSEKYGVRDMLFPLCVVDVTEKVKKDVHYAATAEDVKAYEAKYGIAADGSENFPGWSLDALRYIYETRNAAANGHEALDTDASAEAAKAGDLACERYVLSRNKLQIEVLQNLDRVAPAGALLIAAWPNIKGATGMPVRAFAVTPKAK